MLAVEEAALLDQAPVVQVGLEVVERVEMVHLGVRRVIRALLLLAQAAPASSSSSTQYLLKPYLHLSHLLSGLAPTGVTSVDYLVVAGGGGGGRWSGGGGAGAVLEDFVLAQDLVLQQELLHSNCRWRWRWWCGS
jgi:hypothetical protein